MKQFCLLFFLTCYSIITFSQKQSEKGKISFSVGYGLSGNIFVRAKDYYYKKNFIGTNLSFNATMKTGEKSELKLGYTRQENYSKRIIFSGSTVFINSKTRHVNNFFELAYIKSFTQKKNSFKPGLGVVYIQPQQEEVDYGPMFIEWLERNKKFNQIDDLGMFMEFSYEYKFQDRVNVGLRSQFYFNITAGLSESVSFYPYIRIFF